MSKPNLPAPSLTPQITAPGKSKLSKLQQEFNEKVQQIDKLKQEIAARRASINLAQQRVEKELRPILQQVIEKRVELIRLLDAAYALPFFKKREKEKLAFLIADIAHELIAEHGRRDMIGLHDKYAKAPYQESIDPLQQEAPDTADDIFKDIFGEAAPADDLDEYERLQAELDREMEQREQEKQNRQKNRKTKAQLAKEAQAKAELSNISKASRRVYTELAKQLHPDKEQDETLRAWKEEAMKKVTLAYHHDDFFELLRLQVEFLQEQGPALNNLPDEQLNYYIQILTDQVQDLKQELNSFTAGPNAGFYERFCGSSKQMDQKFKQAKEGFFQELEQLKQNLRDLQDPQVIRIILK